MIYLLFYVGALVRVNATVAQAFALSIVGCVLTGHRQATRTH